MTTFCPKCGSTILTGAGCAQHGNDDFARRYYEDQQPDAITLPVELVRECIKDLPPRRRGVTPNGTHYDYENPLIARLRAYLPKGDAT